MITINKEFSAIQHFAKHCRGYLKTVQSRESDIILGTNFRVVLRCVAMTETPTGCGLGRGTGLQPSLENLEFSLEILHFCVFIPCATQLKSNPHFLHR